VSAGETALVLFGVVFGFGVLVVAIVLGVVRLVDRDSRRRDAVDVAYEQNRAMLADGSHDDFDMTEDERAGEVAWLKELYGPPVIPGREP
jgi:hypothetical protein